MTEASTTESPAGDGTAASATPKVDPESLAIRMRPVGAIRIKRGAVIGLSAFAMLFVLFAAWAALRHDGLHKVAVQDQSDLAANAAGDSLNGLPKSYADVPKLGPPLPGDLGKPMLDQQQRNMVGPVASDDQRIAQMADTARQQQQAETKAALQSGLLVNASAPQGMVSGASSNAVVVAPGTDTKATINLDPVRDPNGQGQKADFVMAPSKGGTVNPHALVAETSSYLLSAGSVIAASLITGLRSDLPGLVTAQVIENVYDSPTGRILLVPQGSRLIGKYDSVVAFGQKRALVVWQRIILPSGSSVDLDNMPAADPAGYAGLADTVDFHSWQLLKGVAISTLLGVGSDLQFSGNGGLVEAIRQSATRNVSRAGDQLTSRTLDIQPTITIRPGAPVRLLVDRDLILAPEKAGRS
ncbi:TrbI/VirB10 family protein [Sphingomonas oryzagri]